jgi:hypothetical protein
MTLPDFASHLEDVVRALLRKAITLTLRGVNLRDAEYWKRLVLNSDGGTAALAE